MDNLIASHSPGLSQWWHMKEMAQIWLQGDKSHKAGLTFRTFWSVGKKEHVGYYLFIYLFNK